MYAKLFIGVFVWMLLLAPVAQAQGLPPSQNTGLPSSQNTGLPPSQNQGGTFAFQNPLSFDNICGFVKAIFNAIMVIGIPVATFFIIYAGFLFVVARGNPEKLKTARQNAMYVVLGVAVFLGAWVLAQIIGATIQALGGPVIGSC